MRRSTAGVFSAVFLALAPGTVAGLIPWWIGRWTMHPPLLGWAGLRWLGVALMGAGAPVLLDSFARFAREGLGTPAPILPTEHLVVGGFYRYVRNPMYVAVVSIVLGQGIWFGDLALLGYGGLVWLAFHLFVLLYEEPKLRRTWAVPYQAYSANVPRWVPRGSPWDGASKPRE